MKRQIGLILLSIGFIFGCVNAENKQEIGEPYFSFESRRHITLAPDGKTFYALEGKNALVSRYQISPFKKIESFEIPKSKFPFSLTSSSKILISDDGKKLFFYKPNSLILFDLKTKKILKKVEFERFSDGAIVSGDQIIILFSGRYSKVPYPGGGVYSYIEFRTWNSNDLSKINNVSYFEGSKPAKIRLREYYQTFLVRYGDYVLSVLMPVNLFGDAFIQRQPSLAIFDDKTLQPQFITSFQDTRNNDFESNFRFSYDFSKVYVLNAESYNAQAFPNSKYETPTSKTILEIDLKTLKSKTVTMGWSELESKSVELDVGKGGVSSLHSSQAGNYASWWNYLFDAENQEESMFYLFPDGEAVLQNKKSKKFQVTKHARKYLKMKNSVGKYVPMNDATFNKYNSIINKI